MCLLSAVCATYCAAYRSASHLTYHKEDDRAAAIELWPAELGIESKSGFVGTSSKLLLLVFCKIKLSVYGNK